MNVVTALVSVAADIIPLVCALRENLGEEGVDGLAQHLVDTDSELAVDDFVHRTLWHGFAKGLWNHEGSVWLEKR